MTLVPGIVAIGGSDLRECQRHIPRKTDLPPLPQLEFIRIQPMGHVPFPRAIHHWLVGETIPMGPAKVSVSPRPQGTVPSVAGGTHVVEQAQRRDVGSPRAVTV